jgi:L-lysine exporter family protein LysE/ArgO
MLHSIFFGMLLGFGAAIPIGPINLEIIRRNLSFGFLKGTSFGFGACAADITYLLLLSFGAIAILDYPFTLRMIGVAGSIILAWFGYCALRLKLVSTNSKSYPAGTAAKSRSLLRNGAEGYVLTLFNPVTILFWSSVSAQIAIVVSHTGNSPWYASLGVLLGTVSWVLGLNTVLHFIRHRLPANIMQYLNFTGGIILLGFALFGLLHSIGV